MAVKLAAALGAEVTVFSTSPSKERTRAASAPHGFELTDDDGTFTRLAGRFDLLIDTISADHPYDRVPVAAAPARDDGRSSACRPSLRPWRAASLIIGNKRLAGSLIGGRRRDPGDAGLLRRVTASSPDVEMIPVQEVNEAYERMIRNDVRYRFVIDLSSLKG